MPTSLRPLRRLASSVAAIWRTPRTSLAIAVVLAVWLTTVGNIALWRQLLGIDQSMTGVLGLLGVALVLLGIHAGLLALLAWGRAIKPIGAALLLAAAVAQHFMLRFGVVIDPGLMANTLATNRNEAADVLGAAFVLDVVAVAALPIAWLWQVPVIRRPVVGDAGRRLVVAAVLLGLSAGLAAAMFSVLAPMVRNHLALRFLPNPVSPLLSLWRAIEGASDYRVAPVLTATVGARVVPAGGATTRPPLLVLVIGETARADHFGLNGYRRDTTPELATRGVVSFTDVQSCGTHTAASLPCMFSPLGRSAFKPEVPDTGNLLDVVQAAGMAVLWVDNQGGCKDVCDRVPHAATHDIAAAAPLCDGGECLDEVLLLDLDRRIAALPADARRNGVLVVLHQMGSHGPAYGRRSPPAFKRFGPECTTLVLGDCSPAGLVNVYDNSIVYTDHVLAKTIDWLRVRADAWTPAMLYVSDHGESLGEYGIYLHGLPVAIAPASQRHVPMIAWLGEAMAARDRIDMRCVAEERTRPLSHDNLYHSVLGLLGIASPTYRSVLDVWTACRGGSGPPPR